MIIQLLNKLPIILFLALSLPFFTTEIVQAPYSCEDFLEKWGRNPKELKLLTCKYEKNSQSDRSISHYIVKGTDAAIVETFLHKNFKMAPLKHICCGWEPTSVPGSDRRYGTYRDRNGYYYEIVMVSGETLERDWNRIPNFHVYVTKFMQDI
jgi:hypothetical protein